MIKLFNKIKRILTIFSCLFIALTCVVCATFLWDLQEFSSLDVCKKVQAYAAESIVNTIRLEETECVEFAEYCAGEDTHKTKIRFPQNSI